MRACRCTKCGKEFQESDSNPNVHYSTPATVCRTCELKTRSRPGDWYQDADGNYKQINGGGNDYGTTNKY